MPQSSRRIPLLLAIMAIVIRVLASSGSLELASHPVEAMPDVPSPPPSAPDEAKQQYIVVLDAQPLALYDGHLPRLPATTPALANPPGRPHLEIDSPAALNYLAYLDEIESQALTTLRGILPGLDPGWRYRYVLAGFSAELTASQAFEVSRLPQIRAIHREESLEPELDASARSVGLEAAWQAAGGHEEAGLGARLAVLDSGGDPDHPLFHDAGMPEPPEGFPSALLIGRDGNRSSFADPGAFTNRKVIAARVFAREATLAALDLPHNKPAGYLSGQGSHGLHVAGIAAGRRAESSFRVAGQELTVALSGMAPMAQVLTYVNHENTPGFVAAMDQMVVDRVDALNVSLGHAGWHLAHPDQHPISMAMQGAAAAGLVVATSAGNAGFQGPMSITGSWKLSDKILTVASSSSNGRTAVRSTLEGESRPKALETVNLTALTAPLPEAGIEGELYLFPDGNNCESGLVPEGSIVVVDFQLDYYGAGAGKVFGCGSNFGASGAAATIFVRSGVYHSPYYITYGGIAIPVLTLGQSKGDALLDWLKAGGSGRISIAPTVGRVYDDVPDLLAPGSSRGPGLSGNIKPDISAPGVNILSSVSSLPAGETKVRRELASFSGTSMASPHVAGAAALIRAARPDWSAAQVRAALITTAAPELRTGDPLGPLAPAGIDEAGAGRLSIARALEPGALAEPPTLAFGELRRHDPDMDMVLGASTLATLTVTLQSTLDQDSVWTTTVAALEGATLPRVAAERLTLPAGGSATFTVTLDTHAIDSDGLLQGRVSLFHAEGGQLLYLPYYASILPADPTPVLLVNWTYGQTENHAEAYTDALRRMRLTTRVWNMGEPEDGLENPQSDHPPYALMRDHELVILNANESPRSIHLHGTGQYNYLNHLLAGGNLLITGQGAQDWWRYLSWSRFGEQAREALPDTWPYAWAGPGQNSGCEMCLARYFAGFTPVYTATLSGRLLLPFPQAPDEPEREVILAPHPQADGPFSYPIDISTGRRAKDGAAGNQYRFASGRVIDGYQPSGEDDQITAEQGDIPYAETVLDRVIPLARPMWQTDLVPAGGVTETLTVGSYVAGRQHADGPPWNAMFWGFGLEGLGRNHVSFRLSPRERLLADSFNFLVRNLEVKTIVDMAHPAGPRIRFHPGSAADSVPVAYAEVDWGAGEGRIRYPYNPSLDLDQLLFQNRYSVTGSYEVWIRLSPSPSLDPPGPAFAPIERLIPLTIDQLPSDHEPSYLPFLTRLAESLPVPTDHLEYTGGAQNHP